ncbi:hypothetical protein M8494_37530 [Serratia ureilytica]
MNSISTPRWRATGAGADGRTGAQQRLEVRATPNAGRMCGRAAGRRHRRADYRQRAASGKPERRRGRRDRRAGARNGADHVFDEAAEVVLVDLPPDDLRRRGCTGKCIFRSRPSAPSSTSFAKGLIALRELALRRTADPGR